MKPIKDISGLKFGMLTAISFYGMNKHKKALWTFRCDCGNEKILSANNVSGKGQKTRSCGCLLEKMYKNGSTRTHGMSNSHVYRVWHDMRRRCQKENRGDYDRYGGRGIKVCESWNKFENFYKDMGDCPEGMTIDRIDSNGDYCLENCRWADNITQSRNKSNNVYVTYDGKDVLLSDLCREKGASYSTAMHRIKKQGMTVEDAVNKPPLRVGNYYKRKSPK